MLVNSATDKAFQNDNNHEHADEEQLLETSHEPVPCTLPTLFSLAADTKKKVQEKAPETFEEMVATCRAQMNKPLLDRYPAIAYAVKIGRHDVVKFLIDEGESVNEATPDIPVVGRRNSIQYGRTPLEIAIKQCDVEMVRLLIENGATPEISYCRFNDIWFNERSNYYITSSFSHEVSSPLLDALKLKNQEIIDLVISGYTDPTRLYAELEVVRNSQQTEVMRSWIEQNVFLWKGEQSRVPDDVVNIFLQPPWLMYIALPPLVFNIFKTEAGHNRSPSDVEKLLQYGAIVTKLVLKQTLETGDPQVVQLLIDHPRREESPFSVLAELNRADLVRYAIEKGEVPNTQHLKIAIRHGSLDVVRQLTEYGISSDDALLLAIEHRQWPTARYLASQSKNMHEVVELCRTQSTKPLRDNYPPIAFAVQLGRHDVVKFLIDHGESVNEATPDVPVWWDVGDRTSIMQRVGTQQGYSPLELAVKQSDVEMVRLLLENGATPEISYHRFVLIYPYGSDDYQTYDRDANCSHREAPSSILLDARTLENQEIIDLLTKAYTNYEFY
jgi:ankyrin repeat protein